MTILLLDDSEVVRNVISTSLEKDGYNVVSVSTALGLVKKLRENHHEIVILDIDLGGEIAIGELISNCKTYFPDTNFSHEETMKELGKKIDDPVNGLFLIQVIKSISKRTGVILLTGIDVNEKVADFNRRKGGYNIIQKLSEDIDIKKESGLMLEITGAIDKITMQNDYPPKKLNRDEDLSFEKVMMKNQKNLDLQEFLKESMGFFAEEDKVRGEILFYNQSQGLLEQIVSVGFPKTTETMRTRSASQGSLIDKGITVYAAVHNESVIVVDVKYDKRYRPVEGDADRTVSEMALPIKLGDELIGVLNLESEKKGVFDNKHLNYFQSISSFIGLLIEYETYKEEDEFLSNSVKELSKSRNENEAYKVLLENILLKIGNHYCGCVLIPEKGKEKTDLKVVVSSGLSLIPGETRRINKFGVIKTAINSKKGEAFWDKSSDSEYVPLSDGVVSNYAIVMKKNEEIYAVIDIESKVHIISERYQRAFQRLTKFATEVIFGMKSREQLVKEEEVKTVLTAIDYETHNAIGSFGVLISQLKNTKGITESVENELLVAIRERLLSTTKMIQSFLDDPKVIDFNEVLSNVKRFAASHNVELILEGDFDIKTLVSSAGLQWLLENLILNTRKHCKVDRFKAYIKVFEREGSGVMEYWDNGVAPPNLDTFWEHGFDSKGVKHVKLLCDRYNWKREVTRHSSGSLLFHFEFNVA